MWRTWGEAVKGLAKRPLIADWGEAPLFVHLETFGREANLINTAQVTPARRVLHRSYVVGMMSRALAGGGVRKSLSHVHWDVSGSCQSPQIIEIEGRVDAPLKTRQEWGEPDDGIVWQMPGFYFRENLPQQMPLALTLEARCRKCPPCLKLRGWEWRRRMEAETHAAPRTWFGTMTLTPDNHVRAEYRAIVRLKSRAVDFDKLPSTGKFGEVNTEINRDITKWLKRIRKESGAKLRYSLVVEAHKSGLPHYHVLIHEVSGGGSVKERTLRMQWKLGFSKFKLVGDDVGAASYCAKYLSKSALARVRASLDYGNMSLDIAKR